MKRYLITGFSGFVSYYFLKHLNETTKEKIEVLGLDINKPLDFEENYNFTNLIIRFIPINLLDYKSLEISLTSFFPDYILHLAAFSSVGASWKNPVESFMNNTNIFLNLVDAVRKNNIKCRILSVGSSEEYGDVSEKDIPLSENRSPAPISPYAIARVSQEMMSKCYVNSFAQDIVMTRSFNHIGPRQRDVFVIPSFVKQLVYGFIEGKKEIVMHTGNVSIIRDFTDVRDVVRAYDLLIKKGKAGEIYNVCSGTGYSLKDIITIVADKLGVKASIKIDESLVRPKDNMIIVNTKIDTHVGWKPSISLEDTLDDTIEYWKKQYSLK